MTRVNVVPVEALCNKHLLAEFREITRIPNAVAKGKFCMTNQPADYKLGEGHVKFFYNKLDFLHKRYIQLLIECEHRGFSVNYVWPVKLDSGYEALWLDYKPSARALASNKKRIIERLPAKAVWTNRKKPKWAFNQFN